MPYHKKEDLPEVVKGLPAHAQEIREGGSVRNEFIHTENVTKFFDLCNELSSPESMVGPSLAMVTGVAGRGKSEAAKYFAALTGAIYIPPLLIRTPVMMLREICFELCKVRPFRKEESLALISKEMSKERRLAIIDEADLIPMNMLEMLRNLNELYSFPVLLVGEDNRLASRISSRGRLASRIRRQMEFGPLTQSDVMNFFRKSISAKVSPEVCKAIHLVCTGNWRPLLTKAVAIERALRASGLAEISMEMVRAA